MASSDFSNRREEDEDIRLFCEDYPDVYEVVLKLLDGNCDDAALQLFTDEYGEEFLNGLLKVIAGKATGKEIEAFLEEYGEEIYNPILKMIQNRKPRREDFPEAVHSREKFKKGDFIGQKYEVFGVLGEGGFGIVYLVYSHETKSAYALKTFRDEYLEDVTTRERFKKEAQVWIDLERHPYIVRASFVDEISGRLFIAMEHIASDETGLNTLEGYLRSRPPDLAQTLRWSIQFCHGMEHAYSKGIKAHRDIKPANIMISSDKTVKISDFGLAGVIGTSKPLSGIKINPQHNISGEVYQTMEGSAFGTPPYMPPEQFENAAGCNERSDIYSFGIVLYQMASGGKLPFYPDMAENRGADVFRDWYMLHRKASVPRLKSPLSPVIQKCLEKNPIKRYASFKELRRDLEPILKREAGVVVKLPQEEELGLFEFNAKGLSLDRLGKSEKAIYYYDQAIKLNSKIVTLWNNKGLALDRLGKFDEAIYCCDIAIKIDPLCSFAWNNKGNCLEHLGRYIEAINCYDKANEIDPLCLEPWYNKGICFSKMNRFNEAISCYDKALKIDFSYAPAWSNKGEVYVNLERFNDALICFNQALSINPLSIYAWTNKGKYYKLMEDFNNAICCCDKALEIDSSFWPALQQKGICLSHLKRFSEAMEYFQKVLELEPGDVEALRSKIICFVGMGQLFDALMFSKIALLIVPQEPSLLFMKATIEDNSGDVKEAAITYQQFLQVAPQDLINEINMAKGRLAFLLK